MTKPQRALVVHRLIAQAQAMERVTRAELDRELLALGIEPRGDAGETLATLSLGALAELASRLRSGAEGLAA